MLVWRKLFSLKKNKINEKEEKTFDGEDILTDDFESEGDSSLNINCNVVSVLQYQYDQVTEVKENEETDEIEMTKHRSVCYYVKNNWDIEEQNTLFKRPDLAMKTHLKPLYINVKMENMSQKNLG